MSAAGARPMRILSVNSADEGGGAERVARELHAGYRAAGHEAWLAVGTKRGHDAHTIAIPNESARGPWARAWRTGARAVPRLRRPLQAIAEPMRWWRTRQGVEDFDHPATASLASLAPATPDIIHLHNLHGGYFDLRALPSLSGAFPVVVTAHDAWLFTGHCAHGAGCERWETGCGSCPALWLYPAIARDATAANWLRKRDIHRASRLHVAAPSRWLADAIGRSMLMPGVRELRVIPCGIDVSRFTPGDRGAARRALGLDPARPLLLTHAAGLSSHTWRDAATLRGALARLDASACDVVALGGPARELTIGRVGVRVLPAVTDDDQLVTWYRAADAYVHAARADTFPLMVLEALACGTPVIATSVGGIAEQVVSAGFVDGTVGSSSRDAATGVLVPGGHAERLGRAIAAFLALDAPARATMGANAGRDARLRFDGARQVRAYLDWMESLRAGLPG